MPRRKATSIKTLGQDSKGRFFRNLGWIQNDASGKYAQKKFYLGHDEDDAKYANGRLEALWRCVERQFQRDRLLETEPRFSAADLVITGRTLSLKPLDQRDPGRPTWSALTLEIAEAIRQGEPVATISSANIPGNKSPTGRCDLQEWLFRLRHDYDVIHIELQDQELGQRLNSQLYANGVALRAKSDKLLQLPKSSQSLHQAIDQYQLFVQRENVDADGVATEWAKAKVRQITFIKKHTLDLDLELFAAPSIESILDILRGRPFTKSGRHCSKRYAENCIKELRVFLNWLNDSSDYGWRWPVGFVYKRGKITADSEQSASRPRRLVKHYTIDQLVTLYEYATPIQRLYLLLGLNCGFINAELVSLHLEEVFLEPTVHPDADVLELPLDMLRPWIVRLRLKTDVYGTWNLWPETVTALKWWLDERSRIQSDFCKDIKDRSNVGNEELFKKMTRDRFLITTRAKPLAATTRTGRIPNAWNSLLKRVCDVQPEFQKLSIKHVRKTGSTLIRRVAGGEVSSIYLAHGKPFGRDKDLEVYAGRPFLKLVEALDSVHELLKPMWDAVPEPFLQKRKLGGKNNVSPKQRKQVLEMIRSGVPAPEIASEIGIHASTVYRIGQQQELVNK